MRSIKRKGVVFLLLFLFHFAGVVRAETEEGIDSFNADMVVTGDKREKYRKDSVVSTEVISRKEMEDSGAKTAAQALRFQPGIEIKPALRGQQILMQGLNPEYVLILIDGERITGRVDGVLDLDRIRIEEIERIEIVKGAASALYGSDALAGVINIITRKGNAPLFAEVDLGAGKGREEHFGAGGEIYGSATAGFRTDSFKQSLTTGWSRGDGYDISPENTQTITARQIAETIPGLGKDAVPSRLGTTGNEFSDLNLSGSSRYSPNESIDLKATYRYAELKQNGIDTSPPRTIYDRETMSRDALLTLSGVVDLQKMGAFTASAKYNRYLDYYTQDQRDSDELDKEEILDDRLGEAKLRHDIQLFENHFLMTGLEGIYEELQSPRLEDEVGYRRRGAFYMQDEWTVFGDNALILSPGLRYEYDSQFKDQTTPKVSLKWNPVDDWNFRLSAGAGYRAPQFKELYLSFTNPAVGYVVEGNEDLKPERSTSINAGVSNEGDGIFWFSMNYFYNGLRNQIGYEKGELNAEGYTSYRYINISRSFSRGVETMIGFKLLDSLRFRFGYTYTDTRDLDLGIPLDGRARDRATLRVELDTEPVSLSANLAIYGRQSYQYAQEPFYDLESGDVNQSAIVSSFLDHQKMVMIDHTEHPVYGDLFQEPYEVQWENPYNILDFQATFQLAENIQFYAGVHNALDAYNNIYNPIRPRFFYAGMRMRFYGGKLSVQ